MTAKKKTSSDLPERPRVLVTISRGDYTRLQAYAEADGRSMSGAAARFITQGLDMLDQAKRS